MRSRRVAARRCVHALVAAVALAGCGLSGGDPVHVAADPTAEECEGGSVTGLPAGSRALPDPRVVPLGGQVWAMAVDPQFVYALHRITVPMERPESAPPGSTHYRDTSMAVSRVERVTREVTRGDTLCFGFEMALAGSTLWVLDVEVESDSCHGVLYRFDSDTLRRTATVNLPPPPPLEPSPPKSDVPPECDTSAMRATPDGRLWVSVGRHLHRLAGDDASIEATVVTDTPASDLAVDPTNRHLYSAEDGRVVRRHPTVGVVEAAVEAGADFTDTLVATPDGVWVAIRDRIDPDAERRLVHLDHELRETARAGHPVYSPLALGDRTLWVMLEDGLHCFDASTGAPRSPRSQGPPATEIAADAAGVFLNSPDAQPDRSGVYVAVPEPACRW